MTASRVLDQVQSLAQVEAFEPRVYAEQLAAEIAPVETREDIAARDDVLRDAIARIEETATRIMRIRLEHALVGDSSISVPTRKVFSHTVASYAGRVDLLRNRAHDIAERAGSHDPAAAARIVVDAAEATLAQRAELIRGVLDLAARLAADVAPNADAKARDRREAEAPRQQWSAVRGELEEIAVRPERILGKTFAVRLASWESLLDEPPPEKEPSLADLLELD